MTDYEKNIIEKIIKDFKSNLKIDNTEWPDQVMYLVNYINKNIVDKNIYSDIQKIININSSNFSAEFRFYVRMTPKKYVSTTRLELAKKLLSHRALSQLPVSSIALIIGFSGNGDFSHAFKKKTSLAPNLWREKNIKSTII